MANISKKCPPESKKTEVSRETYVHGWEDATKKTYQF